MAIYTKFESSETSRPETNEVVGVGELCLEGGWKGAVAEPGVCKFAFKEGAKMAPAGYLEDQLNFLLKGPAG